jgi:hypothetical protein
LRILGGLNEAPILIGGDLNLTLSLGEVWGIHPRQEPLEEFFIHFFERHKLVDVEGAKLVPTWRNFRRNDEAISKRIDQFLISESLIGNSFLIKSWVAMVGFLIIYPFCSKWK